VRYQLPPDKGPLRSCSLAGSTRRGASSRGKAGRRTCASANWPVAISPQYVPAARDLLGVVTLADAVRALLLMVYPWH
jgi:hypothetical protein